MEQKNDPVAVGVAEHTKHYSYGIAGPIRSDAHTVPRSKFALIGLNSKLKESFAQLTPKRRFADCNTVTLQNDPHCYTKGAALR